MPVNPNTEQLPPPPSRAGTNEDTSSATSPRVMTGATPYSRQSTSSPTTTMTTTTALCPPTATAPSAPLPFVVVQRQQQEQRQVDDRQEQQQQEEKPKTRQRKRAYPGQVTFRWRDDSYDRMLQQRTVNINEREWKQFNSLDYMGNKKRKYSLQQQQPQQQQERSNIDSNCSSGDPSEYPVGGSSVSPCIGGSSDSSGGGGSRRSGYGQPGDSNMHRDKQPTLIAHQRQVGNEDRHDEDNRSSSVAAATIGHQNKTLTTIRANSPPTSSDATAHSHDCLSVGTTIDSLEREPQSAGIEEREKKRRLERIAIRNLLN